MYEKEILRRLNKTKWLFYTNLNIIYIYKGDYINYEIL
jgi:hypothetical protein